MTDVQFNMGRTQEAVSAALADREVLVWRNRRLTHAQLTDRSRRLAWVLRERGLGAYAERAQLSNHESGQDHVALYMRNGNEYVESMLGAYKSRTVPLNVNYRYGAEELRYLFRDGRPRVVIYSAEFAESVAAVLDALPQDVVLIQVADGSGNPLLPGAVDYEGALAGGRPDVPADDLSPDDLHMIYTGGTTGMPKGVLWRQHDIFLAAMGGTMPGLWAPASSYDEVVERALSSAALRLLVLPPLMHGAAQWAVFVQLHFGGVLVFPDDNTRVDPVDALRTAEHEKVTGITVVGDAMARPLADEIEGGSYDLSSLGVIANGGAALSR